jgi:hypothetical protein
MVSTAAIPSLSQPLLPTPLSVLPLFVFFLMHSPLNAISK